MSERIDNLREELENEEEVHEEEPTTETEPEEKEEEEEEDVEEQEEEQEEFEIPEKFKGKDINEVVKSYLELEKTIGKRPLGKQERQDLKDAGLKRKDLDDMEDLKEVLEKQDFSNMDPKAFTEFILGLTDKRSEQRARQIYEQKTSIQQSVRSELSKATEKYPMLKSNQEFRDLVLSLIESRASAGETMSLMDASEKVAKLVGNKEEEVKKKPRPKTAVETTPKNTAGGKETEEEKVLKGIMNANANRNDALGGLGI